MAFTPGQQLSAVYGETVLLIGAAQTGQLVQADVTGSANNYNVIGNLGCLRIPPIAALTATPMAGNPPLTVNFTGAASSTPNPCTTIASYTLDFGDGSAPVTQASPAFSHTYNNVGDYAARLTVTDSAGQVSDPRAPLVWSVDHRPPVARSPLVRSRLRKYLGEFSNGCAKRHTVGMALAHDDEHAHDHDHDHDRPHEHAHDLGVIAEQDRRLHRIPPTMRHHNIVNSLEQRASGDSSEAD